MTQDNNALAQELEACPDVMHACIQPIGQRETEYLLPASLKFKLLAALRTPSPVAGEVGGLIRELRTLANAMQRAADMLERLAGPVQGAVVSHETAFDVTQTALSSSDEKQIRHDERKKIIAQGCIHTRKAGEHADYERPDIEAWQTDQQEWFDPTICEIVSEYAAWRDKQPVQQAGGDQVGQDGAVEHGGWMPIESAPKDELITIWIAGTNVKGQKWCDGPGELWANCYYDSICGEWRTSRPSGHLRCVPERFVTHWMPQPTPPLDTKEG